MPFTDDKLAQQVGYVVLNLWKTIAERDDLSTQLSALQARTPTVEEKKAE